MQLTVWCWWMGCWVNWAAVFLDSFGFQIFIKVQNNLFSSVFLGSKLLIDFPVSSLGSCKIKKESSGGVGMEAEVTVIHSQEEVPRVSKSPSINIKLQDALCSHWNKSCLPQIN